MFKSRVTNLAGDRQKTDTTFYSYGYPLTINVAFEKGLVKVKCICLMSFVDWFEFESGW